MKFRLRSPRGQSVLTDPSLVSTASSVFDLRIAIVHHLATTELQDPHALAAALSIRAGFPPKLVPADHDASLLSAAGIVDGDQLIVELGTAASVLNPAPPGKTPAPAPAAAVQPAAQQEKKFEPTHDAVMGEFVNVPEHGGYLMLRQAPDDNSCLFHAISYVLARGSMSPTELRALAVRAIRADPDQYSDAVLGRPREEYCEWLSMPKAWGGAIELSIFAQHFQTEICSVDVRTMRIDRFGEGQYLTRAFVLYNSIHYDALGIAPSLEAPREFDATVFSVDDTKLLDHAVKLATALHKAHRFTDTTNFTLSCGDCGAPLRGEAAAREHARVTGHSNFSEYKA
ncbi:hypothetical protein BC828DRAFT_386384 [Blastocladiella britannica]|nr:hypothetical protein BC828DRAFT_386384 [Blastocladiella britannica]